MLSPSPLPSPSLASVVVTLSPPSLKMHVCNGSLKIFPSSFLTSPLPCFSLPLSSLPPPPHPCQLYILHKRGAAIALAIALAGTLALASSSATRGIHEIRGLYDRAIGWWDPDRAL